MMFQTFRTSLKKSNFKHSLKTYLHNKATIEFCENFDKFLPSSLVEKYFSQWRSGSGCRLLCLPVMRMWACELQWGIFSHPCGILATQKKKWMERCLFPDRVEILLCFDMLVLFPYCILTSPVNKCFYSK